MIYNATMAFLNHRLTINLTPMKAVTEFRTQIDVFAAGYAARRVRTGSDTEPLLVAFDRLQEVSVSRDYTAFDAADMALHLAIVTLADVEGLEAVWSHVASKMKPFHSETLRMCWPDLNMLFEAHRPIVDAICDADSLVAEVSARVHLDAVWYRLAEVEHTDDTSLPNNPLSRVTAYIALHLDQPIRLATVARQVARVSEGHLTRLFRERHGVSFTNHLREMRLQVAADCLRRSRRPIKQVAATVGYADASRFSQHFARRFKVTPSAYRKHVGKEE
jgi:AraC-like DNA-binding protein